MALRLRVTGYDAQHMGAVSEHEFDESGGSIGRSSSNAWCLPDPERAISGKHAEIFYRNDSYRLRDTSTNGTLINSAAMSNGEDRQLSNGDVVRIGKFDIAVEIVRPAVTPPAAAADQRMTSPLPPNVGQVASLDPLELLGGGQSSAGVDLPPAGYDFAGGEPQSDHSPSESANFKLPPSKPDPTPSPKPTGGGLEIPDDWNETGLAPSPQPQLPPEAPPPPPRQEPAIPAYETDTGATATVSRPLIAEPQSGRTGSDASNGIDALLRAAGVPPESINEQTYASLGQILQVVVQGVVHVLRARANIKDEFRVAATRLKPVENNPLKFSINSQDALHNLFGKQNPGFQSPVDAFQDGFEDIKAHQLAMIAGMRAAYDAMLEYFDPTGLEAEFDKGLKRSVLGSVLNKTKYWDLYEDLYKHLNENPDESFHRLFGNEFGRAYEEQMERLSATRRK